eukprot:403331006
MISLQSKLKKSLNSSLLALAGSIGFINACSYSENQYYNYYQSYKNYDVCNGIYCSNSSYCQSGNCGVNNVCSQPLPIWVIFLITFSVIFLIIILRIIVVCCRRKRANLIMQANAHNHFYNHNYHHQPLEAQRLIFTHQQIHNGAPQLFSNDQPNYAAQQPQYGMAQNEGQPQAIYGQLKNNMYLPLTLDQQQEHMQQAESYQQPTTFT